MDEDAEDRVLGGNVVFAIFICGHVGLLFFAVPHRARAHSKRRLRIAFSETAREYDDHVRLLVRATTSRQHGSGCI
jgi:hypothetical protein